MNPITLRALHFSKSLMIALECFLQDGVGYAGIILRVPSSVFFSWRHKGAFGAPGSVRRSLAIDGHSRPPLDLQVLREFWGSLDPLSLRAEL